MNKEIEDRIKRQSNILEICDKSLDPQTTDVFEQIRAKGFEPFVVRGNSQSSIANATIQGSHLWETVTFSPETDYTVVLFANNRNFDGDGGILKPCRQLCELIPRKINGLEVGQIDVVNFRGNNVFQMGFH